MTSSTAGYDASKKQAWQQTGIGGRLEETHFNIEVIDLHLPTP